MSKDVHSLLIHYRRFLSSKTKTSQTIIIMWFSKGANPQRVSTEIIIVIKQLYSGRIALNLFIASNRRYMVYPLRDDFPIENVLLFV